MTPVEQWEQLPSPYRGKHRDGVALGLGRRRLRQAVRVRVTAAVTVNQRERYRVPVGAPERPGLYEGRHG